MCWNGEAKRAQYAPDNRFCFLWTDLKSLPDSCSLSHRHTGSIIQIKTNFLHTMYSYILLVCRLPNIIRVSGSLGSAPSKPEMGKLFFVSTPTDDSHTNMRKPYTEHRIEYFHIGDIEHCDHPTVYVCECCLLWADSMLVVLLLNDVTQRLFIYCINTCRCWL